MNTSTSAATTLLNSTHVLLDFDGPITHMFTDGRNTRVAERMRSALPKSVELPHRYRNTPDPLAILRWAHATLSQLDAEAIEQACVDGELDAVQQSTPTSGAIQLLNNMKHRGQPVAIVSNNDVSAIAHFLSDHNLEHLITHTVGRTFGHPERMKPEPDSILTALRLLHVPASHTVLIGDSVSDVQAAQAAGVACIGYAKTAQRGKELRNAGATATVDRITELANATQLYK